MLFRGIVVRAQADSVVMINVGADRCSFASNERIEILSWRVLIEGEIEEYGDASPVREEKALKLLELWILIKTGEKFEVVEKLL